MEVGFLSMVKCLAAYHFEREYLFVRDQGFTIVATAS